MLLTINKPQDLIILHSVSDVITQWDRDSWLLQEIIWWFRELSEQFPYSVWFSAVQLWYLKQVCYINCRPTESFPHCSTFQQIIINPKISAYGDITFDGYEWCMSIVDEQYVPSHRRRVKRSTEIELDYEDLEWNTYTWIKFSWFTAVVIQHEYDHLFWRLICNIWYDKITQNEYLRRKNEWEVWLYLDF